MCFPASLLYSSSHYHCFRLHFPISFSVFPHPKWLVDQVGNRPDTQFLSLLDLFSLFPFTLTYLQSPLTHLRALLLSFLAHFNYDSTIRSHRLIPHNQMRHLLIPLLVTVVSSLVVLQDDVPLPVDPEALMSVVSDVPYLPSNLPYSQPEMIRHWGYPAESHQVTTADGYVLTLHRIPHGRNGEDYSSRVQSEKATFQKRRNR